MSIALIRLFLATLSATPLLAHAGNQLTMSAKQDVQNIVWIMELCTIITVAAILGFVWYVIKRDRNKRKARQSGAPGTPTSD